MSLGHRTKHILLLIAALWVTECAGVIRRVTKKVHLGEKSRWVVTPPDIKRRWDGTLSPEMPEDFNSSEIEVEDDDGGTRDWTGFWASMMAISESMAADSPLGSPSEKVRACFIIATTYMSAIKDLRRYFAVRYFYENNLEYEVGYLTSEIVAKYQRMLELYHIAEKRYFRQQDRNFLPPTYMVYLYTTVLEMGTVLGHLCNMLSELEEKFKTINPTGFDDYHMEKKSKFNRNESFERQRSIATYQKMMEQERKKRRKALKKLRKKNLYIGYKPTTPSRLPRKGKYWPLHYGWSIERW